MVQRLLVGRYSDGVTYGMKLSVPSVDVMTASGEQLIFDSQWVGAGSIHQTGTSTIGSTVSFPTMTYIPMVFAIAYDGSGQTIDPYWTNQYPSDRRWSTSYTTRVASGPVFTVTTNSITFLSVPSGFTAHYTYVRYFVYRIKGGS